MAKPTEQIERLAQYNTSSADVPRTLIGSDGYGYVEEWPAALHDTADVANWLANEVVDVATMGVRWIPQIVVVRAAGNVNIATGLVNGATLNGKTLATGQHVFLGLQTDKKQNGLYTVVAAGAASRATFADSADELALIGFLIQGGTVGAGERWTLSMTADQILLGGTDLNFSPLVSEDSVFKQETSSRFSAASGARINRFADRVFISKGAAFGGEWDITANLTGLSAGAKAFHGWAPRDATVWADSNVGSMAIVGHAESANATGYPGYPGFIPHSISVAGFTLLNSPNTIGSGGYFDTVKLAGTGFATAIESAFANFDTDVLPDPYNVLTAPLGGVNLWVQSGAGLDAVQADLQAAGNDCWAVNHASAGLVFTASYSRAGATNWAPTTAYSVGDKRVDVDTDVVYRCAVAHTSGAAFTTDRASNPTYWKALPAFRSGAIFAAGSLAEVVPGSNLFSAINMTERMQISWIRKNGSNVAEQSAFIWADNIPDGSAPVGVLFKQNLVQLIAANGALASALRVGGSTNYLNIQRGTAANDAATITQPGTGGINFVANGIQTMQVNEFAVDLAAFKIFAIGGVQVVGPRKTGWATATGTATRTTFDTSTVTLPQLAQRVKALIDDFHGTAGHGLIGA